MESYMDFGSNDLKDIWDADMDPEMREAMDEDEEAEMPEWIEREPRRCRGVVLHDRLMTDAALGAHPLHPLPIKTEHSYSLADVDSPPHSPRTKVDDMEDECFPAIPLKRAWSSGRSCCSPRAAHDRDHAGGVKKEPKSEPDEPDEPDSSCPPSPPSPPSPVSPGDPDDGEPAQQIDYVIDHTTGSIHVPQALLQKVNVSQLLLSAAPRLSTAATTATVATIGTNTAHRHHARAHAVKLEPANAGFTLPPTPPSSLSSSDSEGALSPARGDAPTNHAPRAVHPARRAHLYVSHHANRQPINTPLISNQPKGSTGTLQLTEEEKRTLLAEGYTVPTRLPLTKAEEKSLKKIRRKIKNKISAQESRRKKKEYMDQLERKVEVLISENTDYRRRMDSLEQSNANLLTQLAALQSIVTRATRN